MATEPGTNVYRDRPGQRSWHSRPALRSGAARVRMCVGCGSSLAGGPGAASAADGQAGSRRRRLHHGRCHPGAAATKRHRSREGELLSLDFESLMWVRVGAAAGGPQRRRTVHPPRVTGRRGERGPGNAEVLGMSSRHSARGVGPSHAAATSGYGTTRFPQHGFPRDTLSDPNF